jgi:hypothetical protein
MKRSTIVAALATTTAALGCSGHVADTESSAPAEHRSSTAAVSTSEGGRLTVMTQNLYLGADIDPILGAATEREIPVAVAAAWKQLERNRFEDRAEAMAAMIAREQPQLVALQEVALFRRFPHDGSAPVQIDFLVILHRALAARGLHYRTAVVQKDSDVQVPMLAGVDRTGAPVLDGVQMIDRDVVLAREDVAISRPESARYAVALPVSFAEASVEIVRGWASVIVQTETGSFRFMTTHLEDRVPEIQAAQAAELLAITSHEALPIILAGDFNSPADGSGTSTYAAVAAAGFADAWTSANPGQPGFTCCRAADLRLPSPLTERIDIVFVRGLAGPVTAALVGDAPRDRAGSGLWPSDHAGVVATFLSP